MCSRPRRGLTELCCVAGFSLAAAGANAQSAVTDLGPGTGVALNAAGQVVMSTGVYSGGVVTPYPAGFVGKAINSSADVAGVLTDSFGGTNPAVLSNGGITNLGPLVGNDESPGLEFGEALGINDSGQVTGWSLDAGGGTNHGFIVTNGVATVFARLGVPGNVDGPTRAVGINNSGQVIGTGENDSGNGSIDGFIYDSNSATWIDLGPSSSPLAIGNGGQVVESTAAGFFLYNNGVTTKLPIGAVAINSTGQLVGGSDFYSGGVIDLNSLIGATDPLKPFVTLTDARGINDSRLIVVNGVDSRTQTTHAYLVQAPWIDASPGSLTFASQAVGTVSVSQTITLSNAGGAALAIDSISATGDFAQTNNCGATITASGSCAVVVTFNPTAAGDRTGSLTVVSTSVPFVVPLAGAAPIQVSISTSATTVTTGTPVTLTWTLSPGASCVETGGTSGDGWTESVAASSTQLVSESAAGTYQYGLACTSGSQSASGQVTVVVNWPAATLSVTASPSAITSGHATTLTWSSSNLTTCTASGGGTGDGWAGTTRGTSGSADLTEAVVVASPLTLTFTLTCDNAGTGQSAAASADVVVNPPAVSGGGDSGGSGGGGGALDLYTLSGLAAILLARRRRERVNR